LRPPFSLLRWTLHARAAFGALCGQSEESSDPDFARIFSSAIIESA